MGLLSWLFGTREPDRVKVIDRIWMNGENRARAVAKELAGTLAAGRSVLLLAHFPSTLAALAPELIGTKLPHEPIPDGLSPKPRCGWPRAPSRACCSASSATCASRSSPRATTRRKAHWR